MNPLHPRIVGHSRDAASSFLSRVLLHQCGTKWVHAHLFDVSLCLLALIKCGAKLELSVLINYFNALHSIFLAAAPFTILVDPYLSLLVASNVVAVPSSTDYVKPDWESIFTTFLQCQNADHGFGFHFRDVSRVPATARFLSILGEIPNIPPASMTRLEDSYRWLARAWEAELRDQSLLFKGGLFLHASSLYPQFCASQLVIETVEYLRRYQLADGSWTFLKPTNPMEAQALCKSIYHTALISIGLISIQSQFLPVGNSFGVDCLSAIHKGVDFLLSEQNQYGFWAEGGDAAAHFKATCWSLIALDCYLRLSKE